MRTRRFESIRAWELADELAVSVYKSTKTFPKEELYGLISQMRRASVSVAANIAEGSNRASQKEYLQFLTVARGSLSELRYYLHLARRLSYLAEISHAPLYELCDETGRVLYGLTKSVEGTIREGALARMPAVV